MLKTTLENQSMVDWSGKAETRRGVGGMTGVGVEVGREGIGGIDIDRGVVRGDDIGHEAQRGIVIDPGVIIGIEVEVLRGGSGDTGVGAGARTNIGEERKMIDGGIPIIDLGEALHQICGTAKEGTRTSKGGDDLNIKCYCQSVKTTIVTVYLEFVKCFRVQACSSYYRDK